MSLRGTLHGTGVGCHALQHGARVVSWPPLLPYLQGIISSWYPSALVMKASAVCTRLLCGRALLTPFPAVQMVLVRSSPWATKGFTVTLNLF